MARGRKPKPTHLKIVTGNPGNRPLNMNEPVAKELDDTPHPPPHMSDAACKAWSVVCVLLKDMGMLCKPDIIAVEMLCEAYADYISAKEVLEEAGSDFYETTNQSGDTMYRPHPALAKKTDADRRIRGWLVEFGLTPSARTRLSVKLGDGKEDEQDQYFNRRA